MRDLARLGFSALALLALLVSASLVLWVGIPVGWLWIGSKIQAATDNLGAAVGAMFLGVVRLDRRDGPGARRPHARLPALARGARTR